MITHKFSTVLYENTYLETITLLTKSEWFLKSYAQKRSMNSDQIRDLRINCEMTRVTARLTQVMAWLLAQKAALAGEMSGDEANSERYLVREDPFCLANSINGQEDEYPLPIQELLTDSLGLYRRVLALSKQMKHLPTFQDRNL